LLRHSSLHQQGEPQTQPKTNTRAQTGIIADSTQPKLESMHKSK
jgi:hypothetical protein